MTEATESRTVSQRDAHKIIAALKDQGFKAQKDILPPVGSSRIRTFIDKLGNTVTIGPHLPRESGKSIVLNSRGSAPIIDDAIDKSK